MESSFVFPTLPPPHATPCMRPCSGTTDTNLSISGVRRSQNLGCGPAPASPNNNIGRHAPGSCRNPPPHPPPLHYAPFNTAQFGCELLLTMLCTIQHSTYWVRACNDYEKLMDTEVAGYCLHCRIREVNGYRSCRILSPV